MSERGERGYLEGYYGRLLSWHDRRRIVDHLAALEFDTYFYAPKEDSCHRLRWREPYPDVWRKEFADFCRYAGDRGIKIVAGVAPGLDFDFDHLSPRQSDFDLLLAKSRQLLVDGVTQLALLLDDIDEDFMQRSGRFSDEGTAHAELANELALAVDASLWVVPRVYAHEIAEEAPDYLPKFINQLHSQHTLVYCGTHTVAPEITVPDSLPTTASTHRLVFWDNLYANDYCPRRLFVGEWTDREYALNILLNPVGMIETDLLLLSIMSACERVSHDKTQPTRARNGLPSEAVNRAWQSTCREAGVPEAFFQVAAFFSRPPRPDNLRVVPMEYATEHQLEALEYLLWKWKTPLSREWYPFLMSLKHDLLLAQDVLPVDRIVKTQSNPMAARLLSSSTEN